MSNVLQRVIVENRTGLKIAEAMGYAAAVAEEGYISTHAGVPGYCFATEFPDGMLVIASKNKRSDRLVVTREEIENADGGDK